MAATNPAPFPLPSSASINLNLLFGAMAPMYFSIDDPRRGWSLKSDPSIATVVSGRFILSKSDAVPKLNWVTFTFYG